MSARQRGFVRVVAGLAAIIVWAAGLLAMAGVAILGAIALSGTISGLAVEIAVPVSIGLAVSLLMGLLALPLSRGVKVGERRRRSSRGGNR